MDVASRTVLVVDDEEGIRRLFRAFLVPSGYRVLLASDGKEACDVLAQDGHVDLVLIDLVMPNQEGIETIRVIRREFPHVKIVAMSGAFSSSLEVAKFMGAHAGLPKPIERNVLEETLRELLADLPSTLDVSSAS